MSAEAPIAAQCHEEFTVRRWVSDGDNEPCAQAAAGLQHSPAAADRIAIEIPVALSYNGISHVVMMMTPADLEDFAVGFSLSEGIVEHAGEIRDIEIHAREHGLELKVSIAPAREAALKQMRRNLTGRTGCGLCGAESLEQAIRAVPALGTRVSVAAAAIDRAVSTLAGHQPLARETGCAHAAAWCAVDGSIRSVREDVGRHNALDKLIGALARSGRRSAGFALVSSRASYEMVTKTARAGIEVLAAVSAPTTLAIRLAQQAGLTLLAFARPGRLSVYTHAGRIQF